MTRNQIISEIELRLTKGKISDDSELDKRQLAFWIDKHRALLIKQHFDVNKEVPVSALTHFDCRAAESELPACLTDTVYTRFYIDIPDVIQLYDDKGVYRVAPQGGNPLDRLRTTGERDILQYSRWSKPSDDHPAWYRIENKIYLVGKRFTNYTIECDLVIADTTTDVADTAEYPLPNDMVALLVEAAVKDGIQQLQMPADINNDGKD